MGKVKMSSVYDTTDGKSFRNMGEAQTHQAHIELAAALNKSILMDLDRPQLLKWIKDNQDLVCNYCRPHNVDVNRVE